MIRLLCLTSKQIQQIFTVDFAFHMLYIILKSTCAAIISLSYLVFGQKLFPPQQKFSKPTSASDTKINLFVLTVLTFPYVSQERFFIFLFFAALVLMI